MSDSISRVRDQWRNKIGPGWRQGGVSTKSVENRLTMFSYDNMFYFRHLPSVVATLHAYMSRAQDKKA